MLRKLLGALAAVATVLAASLFIGVAIWFILVAGTRPDEAGFFLDGEKLLGMTVIGGALVLVAIVLLFIDRSAPPATPPMKSVHTVIAVMRYRNHRRRITASVVLFLCLLYLCTWGRDVIKPAAAATLAIALALVQIGGIAFEYRVRKGLFGTSDFEAREIIRFALDNAGMFSGGLGSRVPDFKTASPPTGMAERAR
jgi:hypothetical protein